MALFAGKAQSKTELVSGPVDFETMFAEHWSRVHAVIVRIVGDGDEAEDIALEVFVRLHGRMDGLSNLSDPAKLRGWLYRVATNLGLNALRDRKRRQQHEMEAGRAMLESASPRSVAAEVERAEECAQTLQGAVADEAALSQAADPEAFWVVLCRSGGGCRCLACVHGDAVGPGGARVRGAPSCAGRGRMMHVTEGEIRAYQDGELPEPQRGRVRSHLAGCARCRQQAGELAAQAERVRRHFAVLAPMQRPLPAQVVRARLRLRTAQKENTVLHRLFRARYRPMWAAAVAVLAMLVVSLSFPQVQAVASRLLQLLRVERITAVQVGLSTDQVPGELEAYSRKLEALLGNQIEPKSVFDAVEAQDVAAASTLAGFQVRLPSKLEATPRLTCQQARTLRLTVERDRWQALLNEMGYEDFVLPESVDGKDVVIQMPDVVAAMYPKPGSGGGEGTQSGQHTVLIQSRNPTLEVPPELDVNRLGEVFLEALGISSVDAADLAGRIDWLTTLVIPVPQDAEYRVVSVDGVSGILFDAPSARDGSRYTLVWLKDGMLYGLVGASDAAEAIAVANSLP